jgi:hypothetical protein
VSNFEGAHSSTNDVNMANIFRIVYSVIKIFFFKGRLRLREANLADLSLFICYGP